MIDPVELKARLAQMDSDPIPAERRYAEAVIRGRAIDLARQVLALSDEVERIKGVNHTACQEITAQIRRAETAESEAQALRERMGEINTVVGPEGCWRSAMPETMRAALDHVSRIAALSTTPKEKEG